MSEKKASEAFRIYVVKPIPKSVKNIRADQPKNFGGYRYTFRFDIDREDLNLITDTVSFEKVWNIEYKDGRLRWGWGRPGGLLNLSKAYSGMPCYDHTREPAWFKLGKVKNPEAYAYWREGYLINTEMFGKKSQGSTEIRVLIYDKDESEAYYVVHYNE